MLSSLLAISAPVTAPADWFTFQMPWNDGSSSFFFDASEVDTPAGEHGFVQVSSSGHLSVGGQRIRFWGTVMESNMAFPSSNVAVKTAERLAKLGFNLVVFQQFDDDLLGSSCDTLDSTQLNQLLTFINELKANGIYVGLGLFEKRNYMNCKVITNKLKEGEQLTEYQNRLISLFDPDAISLQKSYSKKLLYDTGLVNEPAVALVKVINEVSLFVGWQGGELADLPSHYVEELDNIWNQWLIENYSDRTELANAWSQDPWNPDCTRKGLESGEDPWDGTVNRVSYPQGSPPEYCWNRYLDTARFYRDLEQRYFQTMHEYLKSSPPDGLGLRVPVGGVNNFYGIANKIAIYNELDYMSQNVQWEHPYTSQPPSGSSAFSFRTYPQEGEVAPQYTYVPIEFLNTPLVYAETSSIPPGDWDRAWIEKKNTVYKAAFASAFSGKPYILNEYNHHFPNEYQAEFPLIISSYGRLNNWDGIIIHSYTSSSSISHLESNTIRSFFHIYNNPVLLAQMPVASRIFRKGYVNKASSTVSIPYTVNYPDTCIPPKNGCTINDIEDEGLLGYFDCQTDPHCYPTDSNLENNVDTHAPLVNQVRNVTTTGSSSPSWSDPGSPYESGTGELTWDIDNGLVTIQASKVQGAIGFLEDNIPNQDNPIQLPNLEINRNTNDVITDFASISLITLDGTPIDNSKKLLLTTAGRVTTPGMDISTKDTADWDSFYGCSPCELNSWGTGDSVVQPVRAQVTLNLPGTTGIHVYALDEKGKRDTEISVQNLGSGSFSFTVGNHQTLWYGIEVESTDTPARFKVTRSGNVLSDRAYFGASLNANQGADLAEWVPILEEVTAGDVLEIDPENPGYYRKTRTPYSDLVSGVVTSAPGVTLGTNTNNHKRKAAIALMGVVPVKATTENGPIEPGDLLVTSPTPGHVMRCVNRIKCEGRLVGKALEPLEEGTGVIKVLLMR